MRKLSIIFICFLYINPSISYGAEADDCLIIYGLHDKYKPYEWFNENGEAVGTNIDLLKAAAERAGCRYEIKSGPWSDMLGLLKTGEINMVASSLTPEREKLLVQLPHSTVLYRYLFNRLDSPYINSLEDLRGKTVLILAGGAGGEYIRSVSEQYDINIKPYPSHTEMIKALALGEGDAVMSSLVGVINVLEETPYSNIRITGYPFLSSVYGFLLNKKDTSLYRKLDDAMTELKTDGTYFEILKKWSVDRTEKKNWYKYVAFGGGVFTLIFLFVLLWNKSLQRQVRKKSESLNDEIVFRRSKEQELILSNKKYQSLSELFGRILDATPECIYLINKNGELSWSNVDDVKQGFNLSIIKKEITKAALSKTPFEIGQISDDSRTWQISAAVVEKGDDPILLVASDITENVRLRDEALMFERLAAIGEMAASVAHEINNPTGIIIHNANFLEALRKETEYFIDDNTDIPDGYTFCGFSWVDMKAEAVKSYSMVAENLERIKNTIGDLKDFGKVRNSVSEVTDMRDCLQTVVKLTSYFVKKYTNCFFVSSSDIFLPVFGNRLHMEQVMINIIQNACYAVTDKSQKIECFLYPSKDKKYMIFSVSDEGCGMSAEVLAEVYHPFYTTRKKSGGTGLGLSIANRVMKEHKGRIEINSKIGEGTRVDLYFPVYHGRK